MGFTKKPQMLRTSIFFGIDSAGFPVDSTILILEFQEIYPSFFPQIWDAPLEFQLILSTGGLQIFSQKAQCSCNKLLKVGGGMLDEGFTGKYCPRSK